MEYVLVETWWRIGGGLERGSKEAEAGIERIEERAVEMARRWIQS